MTILGRGDWTEEYHALIDGKAQVYVYVTWSKDIYFQYPGQEQKPAKTKRYRVADPEVFLDALVKRENGLSELQPGELLDERGNRFTVMQPGLALFVEDPPPEPVTFRLNSFVVEIEEPKPIKQRVGPTAHLVGLFLDEFPNKGGVWEFIAWAKTNPDVKSVEYGGTITWTDPAGRPQAKETKSVTNRIGPLRRKRQKQ